MILKPLSVVFSILRGFFAPREMELFEQIKFTADILMITTQGIKNSLDDASEVFDIS